jgi:hypothetical protein
MRMWLRPTLPPLPVMPPGVEDFVARLHLLRPENIRRVRAYVLARYAFRCYTQDVGRYCRYRRN